MLTESQIKGSKNNSYVTYNLLSALVILAEVECIKEWVEEKRGGLIWMGFFPPPLRQFLEGGDGWGDAGDDGDDGDDDDDNGRG